MNKIEKLNNIEWNHHKNVSAAMYATLKELREAYGTNHDHGEPYFEDFNRFKYRLLSDIQYHEKQMKILESQEIK